MLLKRYSPMGNHQYATRPNTLGLLIILRINSRETSGVARTEFLEGILDFDLGSVELSLGVLLHLKFL